jgi:AcrR family transcriptional regulator
MEKNLTKKEMIFEAGAKLFAERSYDAVGIRDIANETGINSAMISYYYGGKSGLLRDMFIKFSELALSAQQTSFNKATNMDSLCEITSKAFLTSARANRSVYIVGLRELNGNREEIRDLNEAFQEQCWDMFTEFLEQIGITNRKGEHISNMIFTTVMGTIFSDYLLGGGMYIDDEANFDIYVDIVTTILKQGTIRLWD